MPLVSPPPAESTQPTPLKEEGTAPTDTPSVGDSDGSSDDEPWDVVRSHSEDAASLKSTEKANMRQRNHAINEVSELPALGLAKSEDEPPRSNILSGRRTVRPLSPPSRKGLQEEEEDDDDETRESIDEDDDEEEEEEMPMDERLEYRRQQDALCGVGDGLEGNNICDFTLEAMGDICGPSPENKISSRPDDEPQYSDLATKAIRATLPKMKPPYGVEEQTAIEVEYIEPERRQDSRSDVSGGTSPRRKNRLVQAIAKRAKQDFEKKKGKSPESKTKISEVTTSNTKDNVYASLNPSEKRKFLKLINTGMTPSDATDQVVKEREEGEQALEAAGEGSSSKHSLSRFAFWRGSQEDESPEKQVPQEVGGDADTSGATSTMSPTMEDDGEQFAKSGINYYDAVRKSEGPDDEDFDDGTPEAEQEVSSAKKKNKQSRSRKSKLGSRFGFSKLTTGDTERRVQAEDLSGPVTPKSTTSTPRSAASTPRSAASTPRSAVNSSTPKSAANTPRSAAKSSTPKSAASTPTSAVNSSTPKSAVTQSTPKSSPKESTPRSAEKSRSVEQPHQELPPTTPPRSAEKAHQEEKRPEDEGVSRSIFKPIAAGTATAATVALIQTSMSEDSLFHDDDDEDEIAIPPAPALPRTASQENEKDMEDRMAAQLLAPSSASRSVDLSTQATPPLDFDLDTTYMNSTEIMSHFGGATAASGDHHSVVSGKSHKTSGTTGTNYTTSTRTRRPGAAKQRLTAQKTGETQRTAKKYRGWQESIKEAAAQVDRVWDPVHGWVDYTDAEVLESEEKAADDKIKIPVENLRRAQAIESIPEAHPEDTKESGVAVPFPSTWNEERNAMLREAAPSESAKPIDQKQEQEATEEKRTRAAPSTPPRQKTVQPKPTSPAKSRGWVETMKEATSRINTDNKRWDPERGWIGLDDEEIETVEGNRYDAGDVSTQIQSDTHDFGTTAVTPSPNMKPAPASSPVESSSPATASAPPHVTASAPGGSPPNEPASAPVSSAPTQAVSAPISSPPNQSVSAPISSLPNQSASTVPATASAPPDQAVSASVTSPPNQTATVPESLPQEQTPSAPPVQPGQAPRDPSGQVPVEGLKQDPSGHVEEDQSLDASTKTGRSGRYIQIGDTGSVQSYYYGKAAGKTPVKNGAAPAAPRTETTPEMFGKMTAAQRELQAAQKSGGDPRSTLLVDVKKEKVDQNDANMFPKITGRRGTGPVDLDEIDELENGSFEAAPDFSWDEDTSNVSSMLGGSPSVPQEPQKKPVPRLKINIRDPSPTNTGATDTPRSMGEASAGSMSAPKNVPKLRGPKRDTSPIRGGSKNRGAPPAPEVVSVEVNHGPDPTGGLGTPPAIPGRSPTPQGPVEESRSMPTESPPDGTQEGSSPSGSPTKSPQPESDTKSTYTGDSTPNSVKDLHDYWEKRSTGDILPPQSAEWKTFLSKKVQAESAAVQRQRARPTGHDDKDSLFDFGDSEGAFPSARSTNPLRTPPGETQEALRSLEEISDLSPIRPVHEDDDEDGEHEETPSEVSTEVVQGTTFLQRLQACAAPIMPKTMAESDPNCSPMPMAHLAFMRTNPAATGTTPEKNKSLSRFVPPTLCGKPDIIVEETEEEDGSTVDKVEEAKPEAPRSRSNPKPKQSTDVSSVISDEQFGQKTAYFEALAMKTAVSGSKKSRRRQTTGSDTSGSSRHSESWQRFLDKKNGSQDNELSRAAEKYAAEKVDRMMERMGRDTEFQARPLEEATGAFPSLSNARSYEEERNRLSEPTRAAEDLAAARVEAMMQTLSTNQSLGEDEAEI